MTSYITCNNNAWGSLESLPEVNFFYFYQDKGGGEVKERSQKNI